MDGGNGDDKNGDNVVSNGKKRCREIMLSFKIDIDESLIQKVHDLTEERDEAIEEASSIMTEQLERIKQLEKDVEELERERDKAIEERDDARERDDATEVHLDHAVEELERHREQARLERENLEAQYLANIKSLTDENNRKSARIDVLEGSVCYLANMDNEQLQDIADKASKAIQNVLTILAQRSASHK